jgi:hypothetical protein
MAATGPKTFILDHDPLAPLDSLAPPTPDAVRRLPQELYTNAQNVASSLGGGNHGHLGMLMPTEEYTRISNGSAEYNFPAPPTSRITPTPAQPGTGNTLYTRKPARSMKQHRHYETNSKPCYFEPSPNRTEKSWPILTWDTQTSPPRTSSST